MAYKQSPGRQAMPKTGRGLSPTLMCGSPMKQEVEYTKSGYDKKKAIEGQAKNKTSKKGLEDQSGMVIDPKTGSASAKPYEKRYVKGEKGQSDMVVSGDSKTVKKSSANKGSDFGKKELRSNFVKDSTSTMNRRTANANAFNVSTGKKKNLSAADIASMKARKNMQ